MKRIHLKAEMYLSTDKDVSPEEEGMVVIMAEQFINSLTIHAGEIKVYPRIHMRKENNGNNK